MKRILAICVMLFSVSVMAETDLHPKETEKVTLSKEICDLFSTNVETAFEQIEAGRNIEAVKHTYKVQTYLNRNDDVKYTANLLTAGSLNELQASLDAVDQKMLSVLIQSGTTVPQFMQLYSSRKCDNGIGNPVEVPKRIVVKITDFKKESGVKF